MDTASAASPPPAGGKADSAFGESGDAVWAAIAERCSPPAADEPIVYGNDFQWNYAPDGMAARFAEIYASGKRLFERAYYDEASGQFILPALDAWGGPVTLPRRLVENVTAHIEQALERGYAEHVFFPDMGHSHYFIPEARWDAEYAGTPVDGTSAMYGRMLDDPELLVLYHTAEQLQTLDDNKELLPDPWIQWRHQTRNVVGDNNGLGHLETIQNPESAANTAREYPGYRYYGAGFNVSASKDGCFPFVQDGKLMWYDLSLSDLPYKPGDGGGYF